MPVIEKNIPIPDKKSFNKKCGVDRLDIYEPAYNMVAGDSIYYGPEFDSVRIRNAIKQIARRGKFSVSIRSQPCGGVRVWRVSS